MNRQLLTFFILIAFLCVYDGFGMEMLCSEDAYKNNCTCVIDLWGMRSCGWMTEPVFFCPHLRSAGEEVCVISPESWMLPSMSSKYRRQRLGKVFFDVLKTVLEKRGCERICFQGGLLDEIDDSLADLPVSEIDFGPFELKSYPKFPESLRRLTLDRGGYLPTKFPENLEEFRSDYPTDYSGLVLPSKLKRLVLTIDDDPQFPRRFPEELQSLSLTRQWLYLPKSSACVPPVPRSLQILRIINFPQIRALPEGLEHCAGLRELDVSRSGIALNKIPDVLLLKEDLEIIGFDETALREARTAARVRRSIGS